MAAILAVVASLPWIIAASVIQRIAPWLVWRDCQTCRGESYIPAGSKHLFEICPDCRIGHPECPSCRGTGIVSVRPEGMIYQKCPDCYDGRWPRIWAWKVNLIADLNGQWRSNLLNSIYYTYTEGENE